MEMVIANIQECQDLVKGWVVSRKTLITKIDLGLKKKEMLKYGGICVNDVQESYNLETLWPNKRFQLLLLVAVLMLE